jgi:hypothetical protein
MRLANSSPANGRFATMNFFQPHYVRDYRRFVRKELRRHQGRDAGMQSAVGGSYETIGAREGAFLVSISLTTI